MNLFRHDFTDYEEMEWVVVWHEGLGGWKTFAQCSVFSVDTENVGYQLRLGSFMGGAAGQHCQRDFTLGYLGLNDKKWGQNLTFGGFFVLICKARPFPSVLVAYWFKQCIFDSEINLKTLPPAHKNKRFMENMRKLMEIKPNCTLLEYLMPESVRSKWLHACISLLRAWRINVS